jgi:hypothetical protein
VHDCFEGLSLERRDEMKKLLNLAAVAVLLGAAANADAWWGWPWGGGGPWGSGWGDDWFGDGWFDFSLSFGAGGRGWGRYHDYYGPY